MRVFLDTNVLVSAFATRGLCADVLRVVLADHALVVTSVVVGELTRVLSERIGVPEAGVADIAAFLADFLETAEPPGNTSVILRDSSDIPVVESAIAVEVDMIVTGDKDLLEANLPRRTVSPRAFWELVRTAKHESDEVHEGPL